jgi:hypothetical protein
MTMPSERIRLVYERFRHLDPQLSADPLTDDIDSWLLNVFWLTIKEEYSSPESGAVPPTPPASEPLKAQLVHSK